MAPEQVSDARRAGLPADVYGLGATCYAALTGSLPFNGTSPVAVMKQVLRGELISPRERLPSLPVAAESLVLWMLEKDKVDRPALNVLIPELEKLLAAPEDEAALTAIANSVRAARERAIRRRARQGQITLARHLLGWAVAAIVFFGAVWDFVQHQPAAAHGEGGGTV